MRVTVQQIDSAVQHAEQRVEVVRDDEDGHPESASDAGEQCHDLPLVAQIERGQRLVEDQQPGPPDQCLGDGDALPLPAGQLREMAVREGSGVNPSSTASQARIALPAAAA